MFSNLFSEELSSHQLKLLQECGFHQILLSYLNLKCYSKFPIDARSTEGELARVSIWCITNLIDEGRDNLSSIYLAE